MEERHLEGPIWEEGGQHLLGHTQHRLGAVVLAWDAAKRGAVNPSDGRNLVLHEFAHQLDFEDYATDGAPALATRAEYLAWARVMSSEFKALRAAEEAGTPTVLDTYGATNPAEFFAVATETFFERPRALRARHPELYAELGTVFPPGSGPLFCRACGDRLSGARAGPTTGGGVRTHTLLRVLDFESSASASSATPAGLATVSHRIGTNQHLRSALRRGDGSAGATRETGGGLAPGF